MQEKHQDDGKFNGRLTASKQQFNGKYAGSERKFNGDLLGSM